MNSNNCTTCKWHKTEMRAMHTCTSPRIGDISIVTGKRLPTIHEMDLVTSERLDGLQQSGTTRAASGEDITAFYHNGRNVQPMRAILEKKF